MYHPMNPYMMNQDNREQQSIPGFCRKYQHYLVQFETNDGQFMDGIIENVDDDGVDMLIPVGDMEDDFFDYESRQFGSYGFGGFGGYGGYSGFYGYPRRFRRFRRRRFPYFFIRGIYFPIYFF